MQRVCRRVLLTGLLLPAAARAAMLCPGRAGVVRLSADGDRAVFGCSGIAGNITLPDAGARVAAILPIAGRDVAGIAFDAGHGATLMALVGWDGRILRVLGLEPLGWKGAGGTEIFSRFMAVGDRTRLRVIRDATIPGRGLTPRGESWTDYLAWVDGAPLADAPIRLPPAGTMQARLRMLRQRSIAMLSPPVQRVTRDMVESLKLAEALG